MEAFFLRANCVWGQRTFHFDDIFHTSFTNIDIALTLAARKFSPAQPFRNRYPRFRIHRSHEYDEEEFFTLFAHPSPTISHFQLYFMRSPILSQLKSGQSRYTSPGKVPCFLESVFKVFFFLKFGLQQLLLIPASLLLQFLYRVQK